MAAHTTLTDADGTFPLGGEVTVRRMGFGAMRLSGEGIWGDPPDRDGAQELLRDAVGSGVTLIDTADAYGPDTNEVLIADALHPYPDDLVIATKGGATRPSKDAWDADGRPEHIREACEGSLRRLRLDAIPLYQLHRPDPDVPFEETVGALAELRQEGKVRLVGLSNVTLDQLETAREIVPIASVQNRYNLLERRADDVVDACTDADIAFLPYYPLAAGGMSADVSSALAGTADRHGATIAQIALAWLLHRAPVILPIPGTSDRQHLAENLEAAKISLTEEDVAAIAQAG